MQFYSRHAGGTAEEATGSLIEGIRGAMSEPRLVMVFASVTQGLSDVMPGIAEAFPGATVMGSSTAGEFTEAGDTSDNTVVVAVGGDFRVEAGMSTNLKDDVASSVSAAIAGVSPQSEDYPHRTAVVLLDTLAGRGEEAALLTSALLGDDIRLAGGAAGDDKMETTWVGLGSQVATDALVVAVLHTKQPLAVGVSHGHRPLSEPLRVTRAEGNVVHTVNDRPAWDVWREATRDAALARGIDPAKLEDAAAIFDFLVVYEAGLSIGDDFKMRAPLGRGEAGELTFACGIPEGTTFRIMEGLPEAQISSARQAAEHARGQLSGPAAGAVVFDCVCRKAILKDGFKNAVSEMHKAIGAPVGGFETYGEIALEVGAMSGFHNTTTVVLAFPAEG